jgi:hypothetical protein
MLFGQQQLGLAEVFAMPKTPYVIAIAQTIHKPVYLSPNAKLADAHHLSDLSKAVAVFKMHFH